MELNQFAVEVHENAIAHGWWNEKRAREEILSLIHSEWSEALEEYRNDMPMEYQVCRACGEPCEKFACPDYHTSKDGGWCNGDEVDPKPEGIAVELIDGCIRILDYIVADGAEIQASLEEIEKLAAEVLRDSGYEVETDFPVFIGLLHTSTSIAFIENDPGMLLQCIGNVCLYLRAKGIDPEQVMRRKHEYNKTRPYLHGGKKC